MAIFIILYSPTLTRLSLFKVTNTGHVVAPQKILKEVQAKYPDAFLIAFKGEQKIPVSEAVKLQKK